MSQWRNLCVVGNMICLLSVCTSLSTETVNTGTVSMETDTEGSMLACSMCDDVTFEACADNSTVEYCAQGEVCRTEIMDLGGGDYNINMNCLDETSCAIEQDNSYSSYGCLAGTTPPAGSLCVFCCNSDNCNDDHLNWSDLVATTEIIDMGDPTTEETDASTAERDASTVEPDASTAEPDASTAEPDASTAEPDASTAEPDASTAEPDASTAEPDASTAEPDAPTAEPDASTAEPDASTAEPDPSTAEPDASTAEPDAPTVEPNQPSTQADGPTAEPDAPTAEPEMPNMRNESLQCYQCLDGEPFDLCNFTATVRECDHVDDLCSWTVYTDGDDIFSVKGCKPRANCTRDTDNSDLCAVGVVLDVCDYCCEDEDLCNYDRYDYTNVIPTTDEPFMSTCNFTDAWHCVSMYQRSISSALENPTIYFASFCRDVPDVFRCLQQATEGCCEEDVAQINATFEQILSDLADQCPVDCDLMAGRNCSYEYYNRVVHAIMDGDNCMVIKSITEEQLQCRDRTVGACDQSQKICVELTYGLIETGAEAHCNATSTLPPPTSENPSCFAEAANECILQMGERITDYLCDGGDLPSLCSYVEGKSECAAENILWCPEDVKMRIEQAVEFTSGLLGDRCENIDVPVCDTTEARRCVMYLWTLVDEAQDFQTACDLLGNITWCVDYNMAGCNPKEKESMYGTLNFIINDLIGNRCSQIIDISPDRELEISECGGYVNITYEILQNPQALCGSDAPCNVYIGFDLETGKKPKCKGKGKKGYVIPQAVFGADGVDNSCLRPITDDTWQGIVHVPVYAKQDFKREKKTAVRALTMWLIKEKDGYTIERRSLANFTLTIDDCDKKAECKSVNDPHMTTFDKWYYNNFLEGHFILYRHKDYPYEVQMIGQQCNRQATCNCGAGVKVGDSVFFIDRCRRRVQNWCDENNIFDCFNLMRVTWSVWSPHGLTPGLRVFKHNNGKRFEIVMPHGTLVKITVQGEWLNIWITPSGLDYGRTEGLCGNFDGDKDNDLVFPNGTAYTGPDWNIRAGQPNDFASAWRVTDGDTIYKGVELNPFTPPRYCTCSTIDGAIDAQCGHEQLLDFCEIDEKDEITGVIDDGSNLPPSDYRDCSKSKSCKTKSSGSGSKNVVSRYKRDVDDTDLVLEDTDDYHIRVRRQEEVDPDDLDLDLTYEAEPISNDPVVRDQARTKCETFYNANAVYTACKQNVPGAEIDNDIEGCVEDLVVTGTDDWMTSTLESMKEACMTELARNEDFSETDEGNAIIDDIASISCPLECSGHGNCVEGICECTDPYTGLDCSFDSTATPDYLTIMNDGLCDTKDFETACKFIEIQGRGFVPDTVMCSMTPVTVTENGVKVTGDAMTSPGDLFSPNQVTCAIPDLSTRTVSPDGVSGYNVQIGNNASGLSEEIFQFVTYNSLCYECVSGTELVCTRTTSSCVISGECIAQGESQPDDMCMLCDPTQTDTDYVRDQSMECSGMSSGNIVAIVVPTVAFAVILCVLGVVFYKRSHRNKKAYLQRSYKDTDKNEYVMEPSFENAAYLSEEIPQVYHRKVESTDLSDLTKL